MTAENETVKAQASANVKSLLAPSLLLSFATVPLLVGLVGAKALAEAVRELGLLSEDLFRGDRLPILNVPEPTDAVLEHDEPH